MEPHNCATLNGDCAECGATLHEIDDGLAPECRKVHGPYAAAIILLRTQSRRFGVMENDARRFMESAEAQVVAYQQAARDLNAKKREIDAALAFLGDVV
jgi:hypothetical protein